MIDQEEEDDERERESSLRGVKKVKSTSRRIYSAVVDADVYGFSRGG